jgi:serine protease
MLYQIRNVIPSLFCLPIIKQGLLILFSLILCACGGSGSGSSSEDGVLRLSGTITVQRDSDVDLDLNSSTSLNNEIDDPQIITNPSTIGGYLSGYSGTYSNSGKNTFNEDMRDYFNVSLVKGQEIQISVFQADSQLNTIELELALFDDSKVKQASLDIDVFSSTTLIVPADGLYTLSLGVSALTSPLLYTLSLTQTISSQALSVSDIKMLSQDFIPGEVLISLKKDRNVAETENMLGKAVSAQAKMASNNKSLIEPLLENLVLKETIPNIATVYKLNPTSVDNVVRIASYTEPSAKEQLSSLEQKIQTLELIKQLNASELVEFAEPNYIYHSASSIDDPRLSDQWNLSMVSAPAAWQLANGQNIVVAVLDTGINASHEDLYSNIHPDGYDFITDDKSSGDGDGLDPNPNDEGNSYHGSHVAGIIAAEADNTKGIAGLAYASKILPLRVLGVQDSGSSSDIAQAILYAAGLANNSGKKLDQAADIINMSFGGEAQSETVKAALDQAYNEGLILIAAAGNIATDTAFYPAAFDNVIGVGAVSDDKKRASFSNYGINLNLVAPGGTGSGSASFDGFQDAILSTVGANNYAEYIGTSMAAPHVAAIAALIKELKPDLTGQSFKDALEAGYLSQSLNTNTPDINNFYGKGLIDAAKAVNWATGGASMPGILSVYPTKFGFYGSNIKSELSLLNPSNSLIKINEPVMSQQNWLNIDKGTVDENGLGTYLVEVNLALVSLGQGKITINYQINNGQLQQQEIQVFVSRNSQSDPNIGNLYVSLYKEEDVLNDIYQPAYGIPADLKNGSYSFCFNNIASGRYLLTASTDHDGDKVFPFDRGEAVGSFPLLSRPSFIEVSSKSLSNMNFDIQYPAFSSSEANLGVTQQQRVNISSSIIKHSVMVALDYKAQIICP